MKSLMTSFVVTLSLSTAAFAGDNGGGSISCKSASGRTTLSGAAGATINGWGHAQIDLTVDKQTLSYGNPSGVQVKENGNLISDSVVADETTGVFTMTFVELINDHRELYSKNLLELVAIPTTFKETSAKDVYKFKAKLNGEDPRKEKQGEYLYNIELLCELDVTL